MVRAQTIAVGLAGVFGAMMLGLSLGNSALSQINPIHFQGAALHPRERGAAIDPDRPTVIPNTYEQLYGWSQGAHARAQACPGCTFDSPAAPAAEVQVASATHFGGGRTEGQARDRTAIDAAYEDNIEEAERRRAAMQRLASYADYRVSEDEVVRDPPRERPSYAENDVVTGEDEGGEREDYQE